jgi:hypothetical protein
MCAEDQGCQIFLSKHTKVGRYMYQMTTKYTKRPQMIPNGGKILQMVVFLSPPNLAKFGIFGLKINHLATVLKITVP